MHMHPYWKLLDPLSSWSGYRPGTAPPFTSSGLNAGELAASSQATDPTVSLDVQSLLQNLHWYVILEPKEYSRT